MVRLIQRHTARKMDFPDEGPARDMRYGGIENLRPETRAAGQPFLVKNKNLMEAQQKQQP